jgi:DNA-binding transcriptional LysR family regulator
LIDALTSSALDFAFVRPPFPANPNVAFETLAEEAMVAALPAGHRLGGVAPLRLQDLADERFILYPRATGRGLADAVVDACRQAGFDPRIAQEAPQLSSTINLVAAGMGVSIVPNGLRQVRPNDVLYLGISDLPLKAYLGLAGRVADTSPLAGNFRSAVETCREA